MYIVYTHIHVHVHVQYIHMFIVHSVCKRGDWVLMIGAYSPKVVWDTSIELVAGLD